MDYKPVYVSTRVFVSCLSLERAIWTCTGKSSHYLYILCLLALCSCSFFMDFFFTRHYYFLVQFNSVRWTLPRSVYIVSVQQLQYIQLNVWGICMHLSARSDIWKVMQATKTSTIAEQSLVKFHSHRLQTSPLSCPICSSNKIHWFPLWVAFWSNRWVGLSANLTQKTETPRVAEKNGRWREIKIGNTVVLKNGGGECVGV